MDWPQLPSPALVTIHPYSPESLGSNLVGTGTAMTGAASATYPAANRALYIPVTLAVPTLVVKLASYNGATVSGNIDVGIYDRVGTRLVSAGSTAQAGASAWQEFDITDTLLGPGCFFLAVAMDNTTGTLFRVLGGQARYLTAHGMAQQATAFPLPATATFAAPAVAVVPMIMLTGRTVV